MQSFLEVQLCKYILVYRLHSPFCLDTSHSLLPSTSRHAVCFLTAFPHALCSCILFSQSLQTHPFNPLQPLSKYFPLGTPGCLLLSPFVYCLLLQSLSMEIRGGPPTLSQAEFPHCKQWKWQLSSLGWSAYLSLGKPSGEDSLPC